LSPPVAMCIFRDDPYTKGLPVRTNIEIDDKLMARAQELTGLKTKRAVVEQALKELVEWRSRQKLLEAAGKYPWEGDLDRMRGRPPRAPE
jgi:Arc/MetJ family transcription regulator